VKVVAELAAVVVVAQQKAVVVAWEPADSRSHKLARVCHHQVVPGGLRWLAGESEDHSLAPTGVSESI